MIPRCTSVSERASLQANTIVRELKKDLPKQYAYPRKMNWEIYDTTVTFDDPLTKLRGKLAYRVR